MVLPDIVGAFSVSSNYIDAEPRQAVQLSTFATTLIDSSENVGKYVTIKSSVPLWKLEDKETKKDCNNTGLIGQTLQIKEEVIDSKNVTFYLLINNKQNEIGFVNVSDVNVIDSRGGSYHSYGKFVTVV